MPAGRPRKNPLERFIKFVRIDARGCWIWTGAKDRWGYSLFTPESYKSMRGHRWAWANIRCEALLEGLELDHFCRVTSCVNPWHLRQVDHRTNTLASNNPLAINARKMVCLRGHVFDAVQGPNGKWRRCDRCSRVAKRRYYWKGRTRVKARYSNMKFPEDEDADH